jgi:hypothetical protein
MRVVLAKKISLIPRWTLRIFGDQEAAEKYKARIFYGGVEVQSRLVHIVLRLMITSLFPVLKNVRRFYFRIIGLEARHRKYRRDSLFDERILVAANEHHFLGHGVRALT